MDNLQIRENVDHFVERVEKIRWYTMAQQFRCCPDVICQASLHCGSEWLPLARRATAASRFWLLQ